MTAEIEYCVIRVDGFRQNYTKHAHAFYDAEKMQGVRAVCKVLNGDLNKLAFINVWGNAFRGDYERLKATQPCAKFHVI